MVILAYKAIFLFPNTCISIQQAMGILYLLILDSSAIFPDFSSSMLYIFLKSNTIIFHVFKRCVSVDQSSVLQNWQIIF